MEMRAVEDIAIGRDLTPPLPPLAFVLNDAALSSHCSACFSTLPPHPFFPTLLQNPSHVRKNTPTPLYCSPLCSSLDSPRHFSSGESYLLSLFCHSPPSTWDNSSDLRLSLRLLYGFREHLRDCSVLPSFPGSTTSEQRLLLGGKKDYPFQQIQNVEGPDDYLENKEEQRENMKSCCHDEIVRERIAGLMTNRERLIFEATKKDQFQGINEEENPNENRDDSSESTESVLERIREGAALMAKARRMCLNEDENVEKEEEFVVEEVVLCLVLTNAVEVQDRSGCSIGVAVYGTSFSWINHSCSPNACYRFSMGLENNEQPRSRIVPAAKTGHSENDNGLMMEGQHLYGPRIIVRSIKAVEKGKEVTIAYTDLLQPKEMRQAELWLKYRFSCCCQRCVAVPKTYLDCALQALSAVNPDSCKSSINEIEKLTQSFGDAINDYLSLGDPRSCCMKLENLLSHGHLIDELLEPKEAKSPPKLKLQPFHHLSLDAYTTLASAYKVQASDLLALNSEAGSQKLEQAFNMYKTSAAYSLLLAGAVHHLYMFESALVASVANFWINAGESLLSLARSSFWDSFLNPGLNHIEFSSFPTQKCNRCCLTDTFEPNLMQSEEIKRRISNCIAKETSHIWSMLASDSRFLRLIQNPIDFSWLASAETSTDLQLHVAEPAVEKGCLPLKAGRRCNEDQVGMNLIEVGIHCLRYGKLLSTICYGLSAEMNYYTTDYRECINNPKVLQ
ncbi:protein SET DOMAIN GROUP 41 [Sesamum alatum]|uniref:Protein SET DOMAIN GROUP 41 n=1 Tax=Sesamum alatum TaxID=300844 RepID=A0AAE1YQG8_9LAMI|nr:protein SET DOMAIN GROUP 41 [Sesamum alatum]